MANYVTIFNASDEDKLKWAFRLYDMDNNGVIDMDEMAAIIETLDCIEGVKPGELVRGLKKSLFRYIHTDKIFQF